MGYQAKQILRNYKLPIPKGALCNLVEDSQKIAASVSNNSWVIKAQIHAGGRGKAGGIKLAKSLVDVKNITSQMIGMLLINEQTGPEGKRVRKVYIEEGSNIKKEYYLS